MAKNLFQRIILPGLVLQSTMIGGGYATGRELIEFFLKLGPLAALVAMLISTLVISLVCIVAFEFARSFHTYDYRLFFQKLLGPGWIVFEIAYVAAILLVLSILGAASGELVHNLLNIPALWGTIFLMAAVGILVFYGSSVIEKFLSSWSLILYIAYFALIIWSVVIFGSDISSNITTNQQPDIDMNTLSAGWSYASYNVVVFTAVLFVVRHFNSRSDSFWAGLLCGPLAMIPGFLLIIAMIAHYPNIIETSLPISYLLEKLQTPGFMLLFQVVIFGTFIETGTAMLHSINERISAVYTQKSNKMPQYLRPIVAIVFLFVAIFLAESIGLVSLIGQGYSYSAYLFMAIFVIPLLTRGVWLIYKNQMSKVVNNHNKI